MSKPPPPKVFVREATGLVRQISGSMALILNLFTIAPALVLLWIVVGQGVFPGSNMLISTALALGSSLVMAVMYYQFSTVFPRSGGDYVYIGRTLHPSLGMMCNFVVFLIFISAAGLFAVYVSSFGFGPMFAILGLLYGSSYLSSVASSFSVPFNQFIIAIGLLIVFNAFVFLGTRVTFLAQKTLFAITYLGIIVYIVAIAATSHSSFVANFNSVSSTSYDQVIAAAQSAGANIQYNWTDTFGAVVYANLAVLGYISSSYVGGEVRTPEKGQLLGIVGSVFVYIAFMIAAIGVTYVTMGHDFLASIGYLAVNGNANYTLPAPLPILTALAGMGTLNAPLEILLGVSIVATLIGCIIALTFCSSRMTFAWAFDAVIPTKFADVNERFQSPHYSLILMTVLEMFFVYLTVYTPAMAYLTYNVTGEFAVLAILGVAAITLPYRRWKSLFESSSWVVTRKIAGVPVIVIMGVLSIVDGIAVAYATLSPQISGPFNPAYISMTGLFFVAGFAYYWLSYVIQKKRGIPVDIMHREIPPE